MNENMDRMLNDEYGYLGVYRWCKCPNGRKDFPFVKSDHILGVNFCIHCGGVVRPKNDDVKEFDY